MGVPIPIDVEEQIKALLAQGVPLREIARQGICHRKTAARVRDREVKRPLPPEPEDPEDEGGPVEVDQYQCRGCSRAADRAVWVTLAPCPACDARAAGGILQRDKVA